MCAQDYAGMHVVRHLIETMDIIPDELPTDPGDSLPANIYCIGLWPEFR